MSNTINLKEMFILFACTVAILFSAFAVTIPPAEVKAGSNVTIEETDNSSLHTSKDFLFQQRPFR